MISIVDASSTSMQLDPLYSPTSIFDFERDITLQRQDGATNNSATGDGYYKPKEIVFTGKKRYSSISDRDTAISALKTLLSTISTLNYGSFSITLTSGYCTATTNDTTLDTTVEIVLFPSVTNYV